jgi:hypothetical protein
VFITLVASAVPLASATDCAANPPPLRMIVASALPAARLVGERALSVGAGFEMVTEAEALALGSATLVALTVTSFGDGGTSGAVYTPAVLIVPTVLFPLTVPFTAHETLLLDEPVTVAEKVDVWPVSNEAPRGERATVIAGVTVPTGLPPPQPAVSMARSAMKIAPLEFRKSGNRLFPSRCPVG